MLQARNRRSASEFKVKDAPLRDAKALLQPSSTSSPVSATPHMHRSTWLPSRMAAAPPAKEMPTWQSRTTLRRICTAWPEWAAISIPTPLPPVSTSHRSTLQPPAKSNAGPPPWTRRQSRLSTTVFTAPPAATIKPSSPSRQAVLSAGPSMYKARSRIIGLSSFSQCADMTWIRVPFSAPSTAEATVGNSAEGTTRRGMLSRSAVRLAIAVISQAGNQSGDEPAPSAWRHG
mmetsp:Transcript_61579/g.115157  ORF Transcript_61579/g.115157 Transcript_61579/m.115157 type:complete len:231 (+) Transcript_61579:368-1060(+)